MLILFFNAILNDDFECTASLWYILQTTPNFYIFLSTYVCIFVMILRTHDFCIVIKYYIIILLLNKVFKILNNILGFLFLFPFRIRFLTRSAAKLGYTNEESFGNKAVFYCICINCEFFWKVFKIFCVCTMKLNILKARYCNYLNLKYKINLKI